MPLALNVDYIPVLIANGTALSAAVSFGAGMMTAIAMPTAWTAAALTFQGSPDGGVTWLEVVDTTGAALSYTVAAGTFIQTPANWGGMNLLRVRSGTAATPVNQAADRMLTIISKPGS